MSDRRSAVRRLARPGGATRSRLVSISQEPRFEQGLFLAFEYRTTRGVYSGSS